MLNTCGLVRRSVYISRYHFSGFSYSITYITCLTIVYPAVDVYPRKQTVPEGKTTNISCKAKGVPLSMLSWKFDGGELSPTAVIMNTSDGSLLQLPNTTKSMEGKYECKATNKTGEENSTSALHVLGLYRLQVVKSDFTKSQADTLVVSRQTFFFA